MTPAAPHWADQQLGDLPRNWWPAVGVIASLIAGVGAWYGVARLVGHIAGHFAR